MKKKTKQKRLGNARTLLIEIGTEELPPKALRQLGRALCGGIVDGLKKCSVAFGSLAFPERDTLALIQAGERRLLASAESGRGDPGADSGVYYFAAPRRLAVQINNVVLKQADVDRERRGPALKAAFDAQGQATAAARGFAGSCGVAVEKLERLENEKGGWLVYRQRVKGQPTKKLVAGVVEDALRRMPIPKRMRWGDLDAEFVRPVHWLVILLGDKVIHTEILSVKAGRTTYGHRFHYPKPINIPSAGRYNSLLVTRGWVIPDFFARREKIRREVNRLAARYRGVALMGDDLLDEVTGLVEWPQPIIGAFDKDFLSIPQEALITTMRDNQKYFPVTNKKGRLLPYFVAVSNIKSRNTKRVREGNERVLRARFADARFFFETDRKTRLEDRAAGLKDVVFHVKLGTLFEKVERVRQLAGVVAGALGADQALAERAAQLAKADLLSGMVGEFPELQGTMGRYYAVNDGEHTEVAAAMEEQYLPRFAGDAVPKTATGQSLAIADKLDTLVGIFSVDEAPSGDKDPYALRRAALGTLRIMVERKLGLDLSELLTKSAQIYSGQRRVHSSRMNGSQVTGIKKVPQAIVDQVYSFMMERLRAYYHDAGISTDVFEAVTACRPAQPLDFDRRVRAVMVFRKLPEAASLTTANKRIRNILKQARDQGIVPGGDTRLLREDSEKELARRLADMENQVQPLFAAGEYTLALKRLARLREPVDAFFDNVMVMVEDPVLRGTRLKLLERLGELFLRAADLSRLQN